MSTLGKIDSVTKKYFNPVDAIKLYTNTNNHIAEVSQNENPFANTRSMGLWQQPTIGYVGQVNGQPPTEYTYKNGYCEEVQRSLNLFA